ncbi:MAG: HAD family hydrolase, partial [Pseudomonadota bacterium]|nr:HAD family hydrolase [Pseudomonadota bacterium]
MTDRGPDPARQDHPSGRAEASADPDPVAAAPVRRAARTPITSVAIASDPLMTSEAEQGSNLRWMKDLFSRPIARATGLPVRALISGEGEAVAFSRARAFELSDIPLDPYATQFWFDETRISDATLDYLVRCGLDASTLVVGYEMSAQTRHALHRIGAPWVDVWLHPVRFYDDVLFGFRASDAEVHAAFAAFHVPEDQFFLYADRIRIQTYKGWKKAEPRIEPGASVFVGQRMVDKSVCRDGRMLNLLDFREDFSALARRSSQLLYQRHPFERTGDEAVLDFVASHPKAELSRHPVYHLLSSPDLAEVMTISSSVAQEAVYFDKPVTLLHRPVVDFSDPSQPGRFHSICQDFVSPHFWAAALAPLMRVAADAPKVAFLDPKDKIRDMLGFYWSYRHIDKVEADRFTLANSRLGAPRAGAPDPDAPPPEAPEAAPPPAEPDFTGFANTLRARDAMFAAVDEADMISLDVFETLIERLVERPGQLFLFLADPAREQLGGQLPNFARARLTAAEEAVAAGDVVGEEVTLRARYEAIGRAHGLTSAQVETLLARELDWERRLIRPRPIGRAAFERAKAQGKRVILVSDTYFEPDFVAGLLRQCGYEGWDALYCSSEHGVTKKSGKLFQHVLTTEGRRPAEILHMGDNPRTDLRPARDAGLAVFHMRSTADIARRISPLPAIWDRIEDPRAVAAVKGLTARRVAGTFRRGAPGFSQGEAETLGYAVLGPMFFGLANWLRRRARADGVSDLLFLSRDGDIVRRCYDVLAALDPEAPPSSYLLASRRALGVATLRGPEDLAPRLEANFAPMPLGALLRNRFGIAPETLPAHALAAHGLDLADEVVWR